MNLIRSIIRNVLQEGIPPNDVEFVRQWDAEAEDNPDSSWVCHHLIAKIAWTKVGLLKIAYIPREKFDRDFQSIFDYVYKQRGVSGLRNWRTDPKEAVELGFHSMGHFNYKTNDVDGDMKKLEDLLQRKYGDEFMEFEFFHVDKPSVDYIKVNDNWQRLGIATLLYQEGTKWMWEHGMHLHASGLQSDQAKAAWNKMKGQRHFKKFPKTLAADRSDKNMRIALDPKRLNISK